MENGEDGEGEHPGSVNIGQSLSLRKMMEIIEPAVLKIIPRVLKPMVINAVQEVIRPIVEVSLRKVVQEEIQKFEEKLLTGGTRNDLPKERSLHLRFLDEAPDTVQTGNEIRGIKGEWLKLALCDASGHIVTCGRESSARVEIVLLDASGNDVENNTTPENFERRIIRAGDKEKPHFAKIVYVNLEKGVGILNGLKLGHGKDWTKLCNCRLGARILANFVVQEAWTRPFKVIDKRGKHYGKHNTPFHYSQVWRLNGIGRDGEPFRRLTEKNIKTVLDFLFWLSVNPKGLQEEMLGAGDGRWNTIVTHAQTCIIDDKKMYSHESSTEPQMCVIYDSVGKLKGVIDKSHFVPIDNLSADKKDRARKLLSSVLEPPAFGERYKSSFNDKDALLKEFPYISSDTHASTSSSISGLPVYEDMSGYQTIEAGSSSQSTIDPNNSYYSGPCDSLGSKEMGEPSNPASGQFPYPQITDDETSFLFNNVEDFRARSSLKSMLLSEKDTADAEKQLVACSCRNGNIMQESSGVGVRSSGHSNASFYSTSTAMELCFDECYYCPYSPNPMMHYAADILSRNETCDGGAASPSPLVDPPKRWKKLSRLWFSLSEWMSIDASRRRKKRRVG
ncbi:calmodulin-binding protein 60 A-like [Salvia miltiorrhiza]|uniref:calmodulin-binding protein 60 A-like n=1 Tax=Salvia miltiorrhiza TaxID=226208 RepID=UPI0025AD50D2|nr:calmodulin-binding protein 60 A-like [Salvia miltiorrhiza]